MLCGWSSAPPTGQAPGSAPPPQTQPPGCLQQCGHRPGGTERPRVLTEKSPEAWREGFLTSALCGSAGLSPGGAERGAATIPGSFRPPCPPQGPSSPVGADSRIRRGRGPGTAGCRGRPCRSRGCSARTGRTPPGGRRRRAAAGCRPGEGHEPVNRRHAGTHEGPRTLPWRLTGEACLQPGFPLELLPPKPPKPGVLPPHPLPPVHLRLGSRQRCGKEQTWPAPQSHEARGPGRPGGVKQGASRAPGPGEGVRHRPPLPKGSVGNLARRRGEWGWG